MLWKLPDGQAAGAEQPRWRSTTSDLREKARKIEETLATFGVVARVREINSGPTVTQFALEPGEGVRVARIAALHNDLALALAAPSLRIEAPVPGMSRVGIEVPNTTPGMVGLRNILETDMFRAGKGKLKHPDWPRHPRPAGHHRPGQAAPPAHRRGHRLRQVGGDQLADRLLPDAAHARRTALPDD